MREEEWEDEVGGGGDRNWVKLKTWKAWKQLQIKSAGEDDDKTLGTNESLRPEEIWN